MKNSAHCNQDFNQDFNQNCNQNKFLKTLIALTVGMVGLTLAGCSPSASSLKKVLEENPDIVFNTIEKNPNKFFETVAKAQKEARSKAEEEERKSEDKRLEDEFKSPKVPTIADNRVIFGNKAAPVTIVEYSDFECPFCSRGYQELKKVMADYGDKVRVVFKHLPLDFHPKALPAAKFYEAIAKQDHAKAEKFHNEIFENQSSFKSEGEEYLKKAAKKVGADMGKLMKDVKSDEVAKIVEGDIEEARKFDFNGTPGYLVNGVSIRGALPASEFKKIIDRHLAGK